VFEAQPFIFQKFSADLTLSGLTNVAAWLWACGNATELALPATGVPAAAFCSLRPFEEWMHQQYLEAIYNDEYLPVASDYLHARPGADAALPERFLGAGKASLSVLDYGAGNGLLAETLRNLGSDLAETYDPFNPNASQDARRPL
jgi:hypothetical protein